MIRVSTGWCQALVGRRMRGWFVNVIAIILMVFCIKSANAAVTIYNEPAGSTSSDKYSVTVDENNCFVYRFDNQDPGGSQPHHLTYFAMTGSVSVRVRKLNGNIGSIKVRPSHWGINPTVSGDTATFTLSSPRNLSVEIDGDTKTPLYLFANSPETNAPSPNDPDLTYFGPGYTDAANISPKSKVYIAGGAVVGGLRVGGATSTVWGHGILTGINSTQKQSGFYVGDRTISYKDFILVKTMPGWQMQLINVGGNINNVRILGENWVDDGMDLIRCQNLTIDNVFIKTRDDNIAIKNYGWDPNLTPEYFPSGDTKNLVIKNSTFYCGGANNLEIGHETVGGMIDNVQFVNNDVMHGSGRNGHGALSIHLVGDTSISNITYDNIRVENLNSKSYLINVIIAQNKYSFGRGRGSINGLTYRNINYLNGSSPLIYFQGADDEHKIKNVTFDGLTILGNSISSPSQARIRFPQFVENVKFSPSATTAYSSQAGWKILTHEELLSMYDAIDNDTETLWQNERPSTPSDWITLNLSSGSIYNNNPVSFDRIEVYGDRYANAAGLNIMVSNDGSSWTNVGVSNSTLKDSEGNPITCRATFTAQTAKYVRISPNANQPYGNNWHVFEMKVFNGNSEVSLAFDPVSTTSTPPTPSTNLVSNPSFDAENYSTQTPSGWSEWSGNGHHDASYTEDYGGSKSGMRHGTHWKNVAYDIYTFQMKTGLSNGLYTLRAWFKGGGSGNYLLAKHYGGSDISQTIGGSNDYSQVEIKNINVSNGQCEIGIYTSAPAHSWLYFDDVEFFKQQGTTTTPPTNSTSTKLSGTATASSSESTTHSPDKAIDNNSGTRWASSSSDPQWLRVDLGSTRTITQVKLNWETAAGKDYKIQVSNDGSSWTDIKTVTGNTTIGWKDYTGLNGSGRYVRMYGTARATSWGYSLWDFEVYGY